MLDHNFCATKTSFFSGMPEKPQASYFSSEISDFSVVRCCGFIPFGPLPYLLQPSETSRIMNR